MFPADALQNTKRTYSQYIFVAGIGIHDLGDFNKNPWVSSFGQIYLRISIFGFFLTKRPNFMKKIPFLFKFQCNFCDSSVSTTFFELCVA